MDDQPATDGQPMEPDSGDQPAAGDDVPMEP